MVVITIPIRRETMQYYKRICCEILAFSIFILLFGGIGCIIGCMSGMFISLIVNDRTLFTVTSLAIIGAIVSMSISTIYILIDTGKLKFEFKSGCKPL